MSNIRPFFPRPQYVCNDCRDGADGRVLWVAYLFHNSSCFLGHFDVYPLPFASFPSSYTLHSEMFSSTRRSDEKFADNHRS